MMDSSHGANRETVADAEQDQWSDTKSEPMPATALSSSVSSATTYARSSPWVVVEMRRITPAPSRGHHSPTAAACAKKEVSLNTVDVCNIELERRRRAGICSPKRVSLAGVPTFLIHAFTFMEQRGLYTAEGIFRVEGNMKRLSDCTDYFFGKEIPSDFTVYEVGTMIKRFFRQLSTPIFHDCQTTLLKLADTLKTKPQMLMSAMFSVLDRLPMSHLATLGYLMRQLKKLALRSEKTRMGEENLAVMFAPSLFRDEELTMGHAYLQSKKSRHSTQVNLNEFTRRADCQAIVVKMLIRSADSIGFASERHGSSHGSNRASRMQSRRSITPPPKQATPPKPLSQLTPIAETSFGSSSNTAVAASTAGLNKPQSVEAPSIELSPPPLPPSYSEQGGADVSHKDCNARIGEVRWRECAAAAERMGHEASKENKAHMQHFSDDITLSIKASKETPQHQQQKNGGMTRKVAPPQLPSPGVLLFSPMSASSYGGRHYRPHASSPSFKDSSEQFLSIMNAKSAKDLSQSGSQQSFCNRPSVISLQQNSRGLVEGRRAFFANLQGGETRSNCDFNSSAASSRAPYPSSISKSLQGSSQKKQPAQQAVYQSGGGGRIMATAETTKQPKQAAVMGPPLANRSNGHWSYSSTKKERR